MSAAWTMLTMLGLAFTLMLSVLGTLAYVYRVGGLVATLTGALNSVNEKIGKLEQWGAKVEEIPLLRQSIEQMKDVVEEHARKMSDFPRMRERLDSISEDMRDAELPKLGQKVAILEQRVFSMRGLPAVRPPRPGENT